NPRERARAFVLSPPRPRRPGRQPRRGRGSAEGALQLLEEALVGAVGLVASRLLEVVQQPALLVGQLPRYGDVHEHTVIAAAETLEYGHPAAAEDADLTRLGAGLEVELDITLERRDRDPGTECGLRHREID